MNIERNIDDLQKLVSKYDTESFAGFFAYFIKHRPDPFAEIDLNKFESKLRDFLYLIGLNAFSEKKGNEKFDHSNGELGIISEKLNEIKGFNRIKTYTDYTKESVIQEMAFRNHFDNGVLSYVEQDLERIRTVFTPFEDRIIDEFGLNIEFLINICKEIELITIIRYKQVEKFSHTREFTDFMERIQVRKMNFLESVDLLPETFQNAFHSFDGKTYAHLMFTADDLYHRLEKEKVDKFLQLFSCKPSPDPKVRYYASESPFELTPILKMAENVFFNLCGKQIPISIYKRVYNHLFKASSTNDKLRKHRDKVIERKVVEVFKNFFTSRENFFYENYFVDNGFEQDLLIINKGTAIIIEIKASKLREPFRDLEKAITRLRDDFKSAIQYGFEQCKRVEDYFWMDSPFDIKNESGRILYTVRPRRIHSVYTIVVTLERFGSLQTDLSLMLQKDNDIDYP